MKNIFKKMKRKNKVIAVTFKIQLTREVGYTC